MLPGFRFLFAATLLTLSLVVFGLGAAALLRASHERFASLPARPALPPVFTHMADAAAPPTLSMLRVEPPSPIEVKPTEPPIATQSWPEAVGPPQFDTLLPTDRIATLSIAPRVEDSIPAPPVVAEPKPDVKAAINPELPKVESKAESDSEPSAQGMAFAAPVADAVAATPAPAELVAVAKIDEPAKIEPPASAQQQIAARPEPEMTGTVSAPTIVETPLVNAKPIAKPPVPRDRPADADVVAALPDPLITAPAPDTAKPVVRKRKIVVRRAVKTRRPVAPQRPAAANPASPFAAPPFGT